MPGRDTQNYGLQNLPFKISLSRTLNSQAVFVIAGALSSQKANSASRFSSPQSGPPHPQF